MPKFIEIAYTGTWFTCFEVADDFVFNKENLEELIHKHEQMGEINFQDGGASWQVSSAAEVDEECNLIGQELSLED